MAEQNKVRLPHLLVRDTAATSHYTSPRDGHGTNLNLPQRNRAQHAEHLIRQIEQAREQEANIIQEQKAFGLDVGNGIYISFESEPAFDLKFESLEFQRGGIELCSIKQLDEQLIATVFIPEGKLAYFLNKISQYRDEETTPRSPDKPTKPKNKDLVESISAVKLAALRELWTDDVTLFPNDGETLWWEVWLRHSDEVDYENFLRQHAPQLEMTVSEEAIHFIDRTVLLVHGTKEQMTRSINLLGSIAEVRGAKETAEFFTGMDRVQQQGWIENTLARVSAQPDDPPYVCLLDTGLNEQHPLLQPIADSADMHSYNKTDWGTDDRYGHGTPMAGLAIYGDLTEPLTHNGPIELTHRLESVKIMPEPGHHNDRRLYGAITRESISRVEINPNRKRIYCMAVTTPDDRDRGRPSSWSATIDALASDYDRLIILSAGNTDPAQRHRYPDSSLTDEVHDPGQAWNALTVGGYTEKVWLDTSRYPGWQPIAPAGDLSPSSCTSMDWVKNWPIKPDIVMEAGNMAISPHDGTADYIDDSLQLLSTGHKFAIGKQLVSFGDTSAAAALASRLAARVLGQYPDYRPETVRALIVHSAQWTSAMQARFLPAREQDRRQDHYRQLLRYCGYGVPSMDDLYWSTQSALTLIAQDSLQPFFKDGSQIKTRDINLHSLPWPTEVLQALPEETRVEMKVTLSYFVEPNPGERGWVNKYRYASHGLRFDVRRPLESLEAFQQRVNKQARDEESSHRAVNESGTWNLGENLRKLGSIHSDTWHGSAAELAERGYIAVYPVIGWWKERANLQRWGKRARYSLIVTIKTPDVETDIYTAVTNKIAVEINI
ncbi:MAG: S8 family peptidase [Sulfuriferula sp.]